MTKFFSCCLLIAALLLSPLFGPAAAQELPPEVKFDLLSRQIELLLARDQDEEALAVLKKMRDLGLRSDYSIVFYEGKLLFDSGQFKKAETTLLDYLLKTGREGEHYDEALDLVVLAREQLLVKKQAVEVAKEQEVKESEAEKDRSQRREDQSELLVKLSREQSDLENWVLTRQQQCGTCQGCTSNYDDTEATYVQCKGLFSTAFRQCAVKVREEAERLYKRECEVELPRERNRLRQIAIQVEELERALGLATN